jgi:ribonuclease-3
LTKARAQLVNRRSLAEHGHRLELGQHLILSRGEELNGGRERPSTLADAFEALLGAIFMDGGFDLAQEFIVRQFRDVFGDLEVLPNLENPKGELQEVLQARFPEPPRYIMLSVSGPDHDRVFECAVFYRKEELGRGRGKSKKEAESQAAFNALMALRQPATTAEQAKEPQPGEVQGSEVK